MRSLKRKLQFVNLKGGECSECGYNKNLAALDFHHRDPNNKSFGIDYRKLSNTKMTTLLEELDKCDLLCANCHRELHSPDMSIENVNKIIGLVAQ